jgi:hypothetical protein
MINSAMTFSLPGIPKPNYTAVNSNVVPAERD